MTHTVESLMALADEYARLWDAPRERDARLKVWHSQDMHAYARQHAAALEAQVDGFRHVIRRAANIMRGGEGVEDQGDAYDKALCLLEEALNEKP